MTRPATILGLLVMAAIAVPLDHYFGRQVPGVLYQTSVPFDPYDDDELDRINRDLKFGILTNAKKARRDTTCVLDVVMSQKTKGSR